MLTLNRIKFTSSNLPKNKFSLDHDWQSTLASQPSDSPAKFPKIDPWMVNLDMKTGSIQLS